jgi:hypothetical protein
MASDFGLMSDESVLQKPQVATDLISSIKPRTTPRSSVNLAESDRIAVSAGFTSREPSISPEQIEAVYATPRRKRRAPEPKTPFSTMLRKSLHERLRDFADRRNMSYPDVIETLLNDSEQLERLQMSR